MEVAINNNINQLLTSSVRSFTNTITTQQLDSKLVAFCTILTVALSIMLSFKQSRCLLINATTTYPFYNVKRCIKCLKGFKVNKSYKIINFYNIYNSNGIRESYYYGYTKLLKLKRLRNIASNIKYITTNTLKLNSNNYLFKTFNATFSKMKRTAKESNTSQTRRQFFRFRFRNLKKESAILNTYCSDCELVPNNNYNHSQAGLSSYFNENSNSKTSPLYNSKSSPLFSNVLTDNYNTQDSLNVRSFNDLSRLDKNSNLNSKSLHKYDSKVNIYKKLPLRSMSRAWGEINSIDLPVWCRKPCFHFYSWVFNCNLDEIDIEDLKEYKNLSEFFRRGLKPNVRIVDQKSCIVSPCDGKILHFGKVDKGYLEQVKGVDYLLEGFLGVQNWPKNASSLNEQAETILKKPFLNEVSDEYHALYEKNILYNQQNCLYHCVIYLAPGDYHRFHSPTDWEIYFRRHFPGELFSVNPSVAKWLKGLFNLNERVVYYGKWKYGFFSMAAVGATNVGSIKVYMDKELTTNKKQKLTENDLEKSFCSNNFTTDGNITGVDVKRGDNFGEFNLGSTIVLIFEAPQNFEFNIKQNEKVYYGNELGSSIISTYL